MKWTVVVFQKRRFVRSMKWSTLSTVLRDRAKIESSLTSASFTPSRKKFRKSKLEDVEECLLQWFKSHRADSVPISGPMVMEKSNQFALELGVDFVANTGEFVLCNFFPILFSKDANGLVGISPTLLLDGAAF